MTIYMCFYVIMVLKVAVMGITSSVKIALACYQLISTVMQYSGRSAKCCGEKFNLSSNII